MEIFYPRHRVVNFYVVPLHLETPTDRRAEQEMVGYAVILRDINCCRIWKGVQFFLS